MDFKELIKIITTATDKFSEGLPKIQDNLLDEILLLTKDINTKNGRITISAENLRKIAALRGKVLNVVLSPKYKKSVKDFINAYDSIIQTQNDYFKELSNKFEPPKLGEAIKKESISTVVSQLTETGIEANVSERISNMVKSSILSGEPFLLLQKKLTDFISKNESGDGILQRYGSQIAVDSMNQFSGTYTNIITSNLDLEWFRYSGANIETTRPFCLACTDRKYFHLSEIPKVLKGDFPEFKKYDGKLNKDGLPVGMIPGTDVSNFVVYNGGYRCQHKWRPVSEDLVPLDIRRAIYQTNDYQNWIKIRGKQTPELPMPEPKKENTSFINREIRNISDVSDLFEQKQTEISDWFQNGYKKITITQKQNINGFTDMKGTISLSRKKADLVTESLEKIRIGEELTVSHEKALSTLWHEIWHNRNKEGFVKLTDNETKYMEIGNEFVSRNTLETFFEKIGTTLTNKSLISNRDDTGYNTWVKNFDHLIDFFDADKDRVVSYMVDKMENGKYNEVKTYLHDALEKNANKDVGTLNKALRHIILMSEKEFKKTYSLNN
ncbi:MAG: hypothetical protein K1X55_17520, partial [Chitinophagales bacterium]|nr:hypothetical protein [Chitinophagales bacterium]